MSKQKFSMIIRPLLLWGYGLTVMGLTNIIDFFVIRPYTYPYYSDFFGLVYILSLVVSILAVVTVWRTIK